MGRALAVTNTSEEIDEVATRLDGLSLPIERGTLLRRSHRHPFDHFGEQVVSSR